MTDAEDSSRRLQRLAQILAESKVALASNTRRDADPAGFHLSSVPFERICRLTSALTQGPGIDIDDIDREATRLLLNEYTAAVAHLRGTARLTEQRVAEAAVPIEETRLRIRRREKPAKGARRKTDTIGSLMNQAERPYLSVVMASRNDGYAGGMLRRLQVSVSAFVAQMERFELPSELVIVDWNPPAGKELWKTLEWPTGGRCTIRVITVPPTLHSTFPFADRLPILIHRARNVGIRRARGEFVLPTSPDILFSNELAEWFGRRELDPTCMYRVARRDVSEKSLRYEPIDKRLRYCREHVLQVHTRAPSYCIDGLPQLFTNGAGDFTLLSRDMYFRLRGIPEEREFHSMHFDGVFCFMAYAAGAREVELGAPLRIYHVDHGLPSWRRKASRLEQFVTRVPISRLSKWLRPLARRIAPPTSALDRRGVPYLDRSRSAGRAQYERLVRSIVQERGEFQYNDADWGLAQHTLEEHVIAQVPVKH